MDKKTHINITLYFEKNPYNSIDLCIPKKISIYRFLKEIFDIFNINETIYKYQVKIMNKNILLDETKEFIDYPITNGDIIKVIGV